MKHRIEVFQLRGMHFAIFPVLKNYFPKVNCLPDIRKDGKILPKFMKLTHSAEHFYLFLNILVRKLAGGMRNIFSTVKICNSVTIFGKEDIQFIMCRMLRFFIMAVFQAVLKNLHK